MKIKKGGRRQFLKQGAAMASLAVGGTSLVSGQNRVSEGLRPGRHLPYGVPSRFETTKRDYFNRGGGRYSMTGSAGTPLQDLDGIITPSGLHFVISHGATPPDFDPRQHRLLIQGMVDRPLIFSLEELDRKSVV